MMLDKYDSPEHAFKQVFSEEKLFSFPSQPPKLNLIHFLELASYHHLGISARQNPFDIGNLHTSFRSSEKKSSSVSLYQLEVHTWNLYWNGGIVLLILIYNGENVFSTKYIPYWKLLHLIVLQR